MGPANVLECRAAPVMASLPPAGGPRWRLSAPGRSESGFDALGGARWECPYWACIPSKMILRAGEVVAEGRWVPDLAGTSTVTPGWKPVATRIREEATTEWDDQIAVDRFLGQGGRFVRRGRITAPGGVTVGDQVFQAGRGIVVSAGTRAVVPPIPGLDGTPYWTNHEAIETEAAPESLIVLGGGAVGVELAQSSPGSAPRSRWWRWPSGCCRPRNPRPRTCRRTRSAVTASACAPGRRRQPWSTPTVSP